MQGKWQVFGFDTFANERYRILPQHEFDDEQAARRVIRGKLEEIEHDQPLEDGDDPDDPHSTQDYVILVHPDGTEEPFNTNNIRD